MADNGLEQQRLLVAHACRILAKRGLVDDVLGHVSLRIGHDSVLIRCRGPRESGLLFTLPEDIHVVGFDGSVDLPNGYSAPNELPLHLAALRSSDSVRAVVHAHPPAVVALTLADLSPRPIVGAFDIPSARLAADGIPVHQSSALIRDEAAADAMMVTMGEAPACLLRGHGLITTGRTVEQSVIRAIGIDRLARLHLSVMSAGATPANIDEGDWANLPDLGSTFNDDNVWRFHLAELQHAGLGIAQSEFQPAVAAVNGERKRY